VLEPPDAITLLSCWCIGRWCRNERNYGKMCHHFRL